MRLEKVIDRLVQTSTDKEASPGKLARAIELTLEKVIENSPVGKTALKLVQTRVLRDVMQDRGIPIKRLRRTKAEIMAERAPSNDNVRKSKRPGRVAKQTA
jgi:hypothetical protein